MAKVKPGAGTRKGSATDDAPSAGEAFEELCRALARHWTSPPPDVEAALQDLLVAIDDDGPAPQPPRRALGEDALATDGKLSGALKRGRNDEKRVPSGYIFEHGSLMKKSVVGEPSQRATIIAKSLLYSLACLFNIKDKSGKIVQLASAIRLLIAKSTPGGTLLAGHEDEIENAWEAYTGKPWEYPRWAETLASQLKMNAYHREERRQRGVHGIPEPVDLLPHLTAELEAAGISGAMHRPASGEEILNHLRHHHSDIPAELTAEAIEAMIEGVGLNAGGRSGAKLPRKMVDSFLSNIARRRTSS